MTDPYAFFASNEVFLILLALGFLTFLTRIGGYLVLARFKRIPARIEAGLEAVPVAVITTLVVPPVINGGPAEMLAMLVAVLACFRLPPMAVILLGLLVLIAARAYVG